VEGRLLVGGRRDGISSRALRGVLVRLPGSVTNEATRYVALDSGGETGSKGKYLERERN